MSSVDIEVKNGKYACFNGRAGESKSLPGNPWKARACEACIFRRKLINEETGRTEGPNKCLGRTLSALNYVMGIADRFDGNENSTVQALVQAGEIPYTLDINTGQGRVICGNGIFAGQLQKR